VADDSEVRDVAAALHVSVGMLLRKLRQAQPAGELSLPERSALAHLDRAGPATASALARLEQISQQSMGATLAGLERRGLVARSADPNDGRRVVLSVTAEGRKVLTSRRGERTEQLAGALAAGFTQAEREQLMAAAPLLERLARCI
jgi:DNA-binding MarR family transcriptional regulator